MKRTWTIIGVANVARGCAKEPGGTVLCAGDFQGKP